MAVPGQGEGNPNPLVCTSFRVVMADTDAARVIFFGAPVLWAERLVTTWLADVGCGTQDSLTRGFGLPAVHCELDYVSPLRLDDQVNASLFVENHTERSVTFRSEFIRAGESTPSVEVRVTQVQAATDGGAMRAVPLMPKLLAALTNTSNQA